MGVNMAEKDEVKSISHKAKYLGGHSLFPKAKAISLVLTKKSIEIPEMKLTIPFNRLENVQLVKEEKLASSLMIFPWMKIKKFVMLTFEDKNNYEESLFLDIEKSEEAYTEINLAKTRCEI
jgi:hypothetical protein